MAKIIPPEAPSLIRIELPWLTSEAAQKLAGTMQSYLPSQRRQTLDDRGSQQRSQEMTARGAIYFACVRAQGNLQRYRRASSFQELNLNSFKLLKHQDGKRFRFALDPLAQKGASQKTVKAGITRRSPIELFYGVHTDLGRAVFPLSLHAWGFRGTTGAGARSYRWERVMGAVPFTTSQSKKSRSIFKSSRPEVRSAFTREPYSFDDYRELHVAVHRHPKTGVRLFEVTVHNPQEATPALPPKASWWHR